MALAVSESLGKDNFILATDFSPKMIEVAKKTVASTEATNVKCEVMDGQVWYKLQ